MNRKLDLMELADHADMNLHAGGGGGLRAPLPSMGQDLLDGPAHTADAVRSSADGDPVTFVRNANLF